MSTTIGCGAEADDLGKLNISDQGLFRRDMLVLDTCLSSGVPVVGLVGVSLARVIAMMGRCFFS